MSILNLVKEFDNISASWRLADINLDLKSDVNCEAYLTHERLRSLFCQRLHHRFILGGIIRIFK